MVRGAKRQKTASFAGGGYAAVSAKTKTYSHSDAQIKFLARAEAKKMISRRSELKYHDVNFVATAVTTTGSIAHLTGIPAGDGASERDGNSIRAAYLRMNFQVIANVLGGQQTVRRIIFVDRQQIADTIPAISELIDTGGTQDYLALPRNTTKQRFRILSDKLFTFSTTGGKSLVVKTDFISMTNMEIRYNATLSSDIQKNGIWIFTMSNQAGNPPSVAYKSRVAYRDL